MGRASRRKWENRRKRILECNDIADVVKIADNLRRKTKVKDELEKKGVVYAIHQV